MEPDYSIVIGNRQRVAQVDTEWLAASLQRILRAAGVKSAQLEVELVDDAEMQRINREFLDHDWPTDVLAFNYTDATASEELDGALVLSVETAAQQAVIHEWSLQAELLLYAVHGCLHLCGYDDHTAVDRRAMRQRERAILQLFKLHPLGWDDDEAS